MGGSFLTVRFFEQGRHVSPDGSAGKPPAPRRMQRGMRPRLRARMRGSPDFPVRSSRAMPGFCLPPLREAERRLAHVSVGTLCEGACVPCGTRAFRRSTAAIFCDVTVQDGPVIQAALPRPFTRPRRPLKAAPSSGAVDDVASWDVGTSHACRTPHPAPSAERLRKTPSVSRANQNLSGTIMCVNRPCAAQDRRPLAVDQADTERLDEFRAARCDVSCSARLSRMRVSQPRSRQQRHISAA